MILSTIKKVTAIYSLVSRFLLVFFLAIKSYAAEDLVSFCFERSTNLKEAKDSLAFLLLPKESVFLRPQDQCLDVLVVSSDRSKLLEKFLAKRYTIISEASPQLSGSEQEQCHLEFKTTKKKQVNTNKIKVGKISSASSANENTEEVSVAKILLGSGKTGELSLEGRLLNVDCIKGIGDRFQLIFSYGESSGAKVSTQVSVKSGELLQIAQITNDLDNKKKSLGLPESTYQQDLGKENISYELRVN